MKDKIKEKHSCLGMNLHTHQYTKSHTSEKLITQTIKKQITASRNQMCDHTEKQTFKIHMINDTLYSLGT